MQSYFEINVAKDGYHVFATAPRSCTTRDQAEAVVKILRARMPESDGFEYRVTYWDCKGKTINM